MSLSDKYGLHGWTPPVSSHGVEAVPHVVDALPRETAITLPIGSQTPHTLRGCYLHGIGFFDVTNYHVGPSQTYTAISDAPLELLQAGDTLFIHYSSTPYLDKFVIGASGTVLQPIVIYGVVNGNGNLPMISGDGATTRTQLDF